MCAHVWTFEKSILKTAKNIREKGIVHGINCREERKGDVVYLYFDFKI